MAFKLIDHHQLRVWLPLAKLLASVGWWAWFFGMCLWVFEVGGCEGEMGMRRGGFTYYNCGYSMQFQLPLVLSLAPHTFTPGAHWNVLLTEWKWL